MLTLLLVYRSLHCGSPQRVCSTGSMRLTRRWLHSLPPYGAGCRRQFRNPTHGPCIFPSRQLPIGDTQAGRAPRPAPLLPRRLFGRTGLNRDFSLNLLELFATNIVLKTYIDLLTTAMNCAILLPSKQIRRPIPSGANGAGYGLATTIKRSASLRKKRVQLACVARPDRIPHLLESKPLTRTMPRLYCRRAGSGQFAQPGAAAFLRVVV